MQGRLKFGQSFSGNARLRRSPPPSHRLRRFWIEQPSSGIDSNASVDGGKASRHMLSSDGRTFKSMRSFSGCW